MLLAVALLLTMTCMAEGDPAIAEQAWTTDEAVLNNAGEAAAEELPAMDLADAAPALANEDAALPAGIKLGVKEKYALTVPAVAEGQTVTFQSTRKAVAAVSDAGVITGKKKGKAVVSVLIDGVEAGSCAVTVMAAPKSVTMSKKTLTLKPGESATLKAKLSKKSASRITWTSSNTAVATVSESGEVTAVAAGKATITAKAFNGKKATCKLTVKSGSSGSDKLIDIFTIMFKTVEEVNNTILTDKLTQWDEHSYENKSLIVGTGRGINGETDVITDVYLKPDSNFGLFGYTEWIHRAADLYAALEKNGFTLYLDRGTFIDSVGRQYRNDNKVLVQIDEIEEGRIDSIEVHYVPDMDYVPDDDYEAIDYDDE